MDTAQMHMLESLNFLQVLTLLLVALLFGKDTILPWVGEKVFGIKRAEQDVPRDKPEGDTPDTQRDRLEVKMDALQLHFNHETTDLLTTIANNTGATLRKLEEFEKYGIPCRDKK